MNNALTEKLQQLRGRVQAGPVGQFFGWWIGELREAMPASWQEKLQHALRRATLQLSDETLQAGIDENRRCTTLGSFPLSQDAGLQAREVDDLLERNDLAEAPRFLLLPAESLLSKQLRLPLATEANLSQVLGFEMDRQTPFKASAVYFDWRVTERDNAAGQLGIQLFVVPRREVDQALEVLERRGLAVSGVDVLDQGQTLGLNLLPSERRVRVVNRKARMNLALAGACVLLLALVMAQSLSLRQHQVTQLEAAIEDVQVEARGVARIRKQIEDASEAAGFLASRRAESPLAIEVLADVTARLPDDTYLDRLVIGAGTVQMQGKSQNAQQLIELVNESPLFEAASFRGSTRLDARTGLEIFEVSARVTPAEGG